MRIATKRIHCSNKLILLPWYKSVISLGYSLYTIYNTSGHSALGIVNNIETYTSWYNLYMQNRIFLDVSNVAVYWNKVSYTGTT